MKRTSGKREKRRGNGEGSIYQQADGKLDSILRGGAA